MNQPFLETVHCNICGSDGINVIYSSCRSSDEKLELDQFRSSGDEPLKDQLVQCIHCGLQYVSPRIHPHIVFEGYVHAIDKTFVSQAKAREKTFARCLRTVVKIWGKTSGKILDVGTASGAFLKVARDAGFEVAGCEPNIWMCNWCKETYGISINQGTIFDAHFKDGSFDIITLWDVLEHTPDPQAVLNECARILVPGGLLVINYPDIGSWIARFMGHKWVFLLSVHYFYYTRKTILAALHRSHYDVLVIKPHFQMLEFGYIIFRATAYIGFVGKVLEKLIRMMGLEKWLIPYWVGQTLVVARKQ